MQRSKPPATLNEVRRLRGDFKSSESGDRATKSIARMFPFDPVARLKQAFAETVIDHELPFRICDSGLGNPILAAGIEIGARWHSDAISKNKKFVLTPEVLPKASDYVVDRKKLTEHVGDLAKASIEKAQQNFLVLAKKYGATQVSDGRSNICNDPF